MLAVFVVHNVSFAEFLFLDKKSNYFCILRTSNSITAITVNHQKYLFFSNIFEIVHDENFKTGLENWQKLTLCGSTTFWQNQRIVRNLIVVAS